MSEIIEKIKKEISFINNLEWSDEIGICLNTTYDYINAYLIYNLISNYKEYNNLIILHPTGKDTIAPVIVLAALATFEYNLNNINYSLKEQLTPGDRVKVHGTLGEFLGFEENEYCAGKICRIQFAENLCISFPETSWWKIRKYHGNASRLEKYKKKDDSYEDEKALSNIYDCEPQDIRLHENNQILIVDNKNFIESKLRKLEINSQKFTAIFPTGYYASANEYSRLPGDKYQREPFINLSSNLYTASNLLRNKDTIETLIINGYDKIKHYRTDIDRVKNRKLASNIILLFNPEDYSQIDFFENMGFDFWAWTYEDIKNFHDDSNYEDFAAQDNFYYNSQENLYRLNYCQEVVELDDEIKNLRRKILKILDEVKINIRDDESSNKFITIAYSILYDMQTICFSVDHMEEYKENNYKLNIKRTMEMLEELKQEIIGSSIEMEFEQKLNELIKKVYRYINYFQKKNLKLQKLINKAKNSNKNTAIILRKKSYIQVLEDIFKENNIYSNISFITIRDLKNNINFEEIIITGWLGYKNIRKLFYEGFSESLHFILYDFEYENYYSKGIKGIHKEINQLRQKRVEVSLFQNKKDKIENSGLSNINDYDPFYDEIEKLYKKSYLIDSHKRNKNSYESENIVKAFPVLFEEGAYHAYLTINYKARKLDRNKEKIYRVPVKDIKKGDEIVFTVNSREDIFSKLLSKIEEQDEEVARLRELSEYWQKALIEYKSQGISLNLLVEKFEEMGYNYSRMTIKNWLKSEQIIGPRNLNVIDSIVKLTGDEVLSNNIEDVKHAIKSLRSLHNKLGKYLAQTIVRSLVVEDVDSHIKNLLEKINLSESLSSYAEVVEITHKSNEYKLIEAYKTNKLIEYL